MPHGKRDIESLHCRAGRGSYRVETPPNKTEMTQGTGGDHGKARLTSLLWALVLSAACFFSQSQHSFMAASSPLSVSLSVCPCLPVSVSPPNLSLVCVCVVLR